MSGSSTKPIRSSDCRSRGFFFDLVNDPKERDPKVPSLDNWVHFPVGKLVADFEASLKREPVILPGTPDPYVPSGR